MAWTLRNSGAGHCWGAIFPSRSSGHPHSLNTRFCASTMSQAIPSREGTGVNNIDQVSGLAAFSFREGDRRGANHR